MLESSQLSFAERVTETGITEKLPIGMIDFEFECEFEEPDSEFEELLKTESPVIESQISYAHTNSATILPYLDDLFQVESATD